MSKTSSLKISHPEILGGISGFLCFIGAFLPWVTASIVHVDGVDGDGKFTLLFSLIALGLLYLGINRTKKNWTNMGIILMGVLIAFIGLNVSNNIAAIETTSSFVATKVGTGTYLTIVGGIGLVFSALWNQKLESKKKSSLICWACRKKIPHDEQYHEWGDGAIICNDCFKIYEQDEDKILAKIEEYEKNKDLK